MRLGFNNHIYDSNWHAHLGNETRCDQIVQMYRLSFPLVVRILHKLAFLREIKTPAHLRHCRDSSKVKSLHLGPAMSPESPAPREPGIQMTGALLAHLSQRLIGELIVYRSSRRLCVCPCVRACVNTFKHEYLCNQSADQNEILSEASLGWGKAFSRF